MMGIMVSETCWANNKFCNKEPSVASGWAFYFHVLTIMQGQTRITFIDYSLPEDDTIVSKHVAVW